jgi:hypothetical protein
MKHILNFNENQTNMKNKEDLINKLKQTGVRISEVNQNLHWVEIYFETVDCVLMEKIGSVVKEFFYIEGRYTHLLPKFIGKKGCVCLIFDENLLS